MISDPQVFDEAFEPRELLHRGDALEQMARSLHRAADGAGADDILLAGPSGVGKTALSKHVLRRLEAETANVKTVHVQCLGLTDAEILRQICIAVGAGSGDRWMVTDLREQLLETIDQPTIVVLDEADDVPDTGVIDHLAGTPALSVVAIAHDADDWVNRVDEEHRHRFEGDGQLGLDRYGVDELADILERRAKRGLTGGAWTRATLKQIADDVAGVARNGIQTLYAAAELAEERDHDVIEADDVDDGRDRARSRIRKANLDSLPFHHHVLYALIAEAGEIDASELHDRYEARQEEIYRDRPQNPIGERARRNKLAKLRDYDLVACEGENRHRRYWVRDGTIAPPRELEFAKA